VTLMGAVACRLLSLVGSSVMEAAAAAKVAVDVSGEDIVRGSRSRGRRARLRSKADEKADSNCQLGSSLTGTCGGLEAGGLTIVLYPGYRRDRASRRRCFVIHRDGSGRRAIGGDRWLFERRLTALRSR
jgi:hypothetical protein